MPVQTAASLQGLVGVGVETPIVVHVALIVSFCEAGCLATHDPHVLNPVTLERPLVFTPEFGHNPFSIELCFVQCMGIFSADTPVFDSYVKEWGLSMTTQLRPDLAAAAQSGDEITIASILAEEDFHPFIMGQLVALEVASLGFQFHCEYLL